MARNGDKGADGEPVESCTIITTTPNELMRPFRYRMPVIISPSDFDTWLDPWTPPEQLHSLLSPFSAEDMEVMPVGSYVSNACNEGPRCLAS